MPPAKKPAEPEAEELVTIKFNLPSKTGVRHATTSKGKVKHQGIIALPVEEAEHFMEAEIAYPFNGEETPEDEREVKPER